MNGKDETSTILGAANPAPQGWTRSLELGDAREELLGGILSSPAPGAADGSRRRSTLRLPRLRLPNGRGRLALGLGLATAIAAAVVLATFAFQAAKEPQSALARIAEVSPRLLIDLPGWHAEATQLSETSGRVAFHEGSDFEFTPHLGGRLQIMFVKGAVLDWEAAAPSAAERLPEPGAAYLGEASVPGGAARVYSLQLEGSPVTHYVAIWQDDERLLTLSSLAITRAGFESNLGALREVDQDAWIAALRGHAVLQGEWVRGDPNSDGICSVETEQCSHAGAKPALEDPAGFAISGNHCNSPLPEALVARADPKMVQLYREYCAEF